jgi:hypothetical protein
MDFPRDAHRALNADLLDAIEEWRNPVVASEEAPATQLLIDSILAQAARGFARS